MILNNLQQMTIMKRGKCTLCIIFLLMFLISCIQPSPLKTPKNLPSSAKNQNASLSISNNFQNIDETAGSISVVIQVLPPVERAITFSYMISDNTAKNGEDYIASTDTFTIPAGHSLYDVTIPILDDSLHEIQESFYFTIIGISGASFGTITTQTINIIANDSTNMPTFYYSSAGDRTVSEDCGTITASVRLSAVSGIDLTIPFNISGTASGSADYSLLDTSFIIPAGSLSKSINISIIDDNENEVDETIDLSIGTNSYVNMSSSTTSSITIIDNEPRPSISITATSSWPESDTSLFTATISLSSAYILDTTASISLTSTGSSENLDFTILGKDVLIPAGSLYTVATIQMINDLLDEDDELLELSLVNFHSMTATPSSTLTATMLIIDNDLEPQVGFTTVGQGTLEFSGNVTVTVSLDAVSGRDVIVPISIGSSTTATIGASEDYTLTATDIIISEGNLSAAAVVSLFDDDLFENTEFIAFEIGSTINATHGAILDHNLNIIDDEATPTLTITTINSTSESESNTLTASITLSGSSQLTISASLELFGTATMPDDFFIEFTDIVFPPSSLTQTITFSLVDDDGDEDDELIYFTASSLQNVLFTTTENFTILDDEISPPLTISGTDSITEGTTGPHILTITVDGTSYRTIGATFSLTGTASESIDYLLSPQSFVITSGTTTATTLLTIINNDRNELDELINIDFASLTNASIGTTLPVTILNDDLAPTIDVTAMLSITETTTEYVFTVTLSTTSELEVTANIASTGSASLNNDFSLSGDFISVYPGDLTDSVTISIIDDLDYEQDETIVLTLTGLTNASTSSITTTTTIPGNDSPPVIEITTNSTFAEDGSDYLVTISASYFSFEHMSMTLKATGLATNGLDYTFSATDLFIAKGTKTATVLINIIDDSLDEVDESISFYLDNMQNASLYATINAVIEDGELPPLISISASSSFAESEAGPHSILIDLTASSSLTIEASLTLTGVATEGNDYTISTTSISLPAGSIGTTATFEIINDSVDEADETMIISLSNLTNVSIGATSSLTITIGDDDVSPTITLGGTTSVIEGQGLYTLSVTLDATTEKIVGASITTSGSATNVDDYSLSKTSFSVAVGDLTDTVTINLVNDIIDETDESLMISISGISNALLGTSNVTTTILDDDPVPLIYFSATSVNVSEDIESYVVTFNLSSESAKDVTVYYDISGTSVLSDHSFSSGSLIISAGNVDAEKTISIYEDFLTEGTETIIVTASESITVNASPSSPNPLTINIIDNDQLKMALGVAHTCILIDGSVRCWGDNTYGQLGFDTQAGGYGNQYGNELGEIATSSMTLIDLGTSVKAIDINAGGNHTCVITSGNYVKCWGKNSFGQLGLGTTENMGDDVTEMGNGLSYIETDDSSYVEASSLALGSEHTCVLTKDSEVLCWGLGVYGQLGNGSTSNIGDDELPSATPITLSASPVAIMAGQNHNCVNLNSGQTSCWGFGTYGNLGNESTQTIVVEATGPITWDPVNDGTPVGLANSKGSFNCIEFGLNKVKCWGYNTMGQLGIGSTDHQGDHSGEMAALSQLTMPIAGNINKMSLGLHHTCFLIDSSGYCWGSNSYGQYGVDSSSSIDNSSSAISSFTLDGSLFDIESGDYHICGSIDARTIKCWGRNDSGQLGIGTNLGRGNSGISPNSMSDIPSLVFP